MRKILMLAVAVALCITATVVGASELAGIYPNKVLAFANTFSDTFTVEIPQGQSPQTLPDAYLFYSEDGSAFYVTRYNGASDSGLGTAEADILVPANSSLMIPAPQTAVIDNLYRHVFYLNATTVTDTVWCVPFVR